MLIFLLGFMGSGKSHCGKKIAASFGCSFLDLDHEIETASNHSISEIFSQQGEVQFRALERDVLRKIVTMYDATEKEVRAVISCGGGTPCFHGNMELMNENGLTVWLNPPVQTLVRRLKNGKHHRPLIADMNLETLEEFVVQKMSERSIFYKQAVLIDTSDDCPLQLIQKHIYHV
ncbi:MAG: shikimate kinase [Bacteroidota bacterium]